MGSEGNADGAQIQEVLHGVISSGSIASYITSPQGFQFRRLGTGEPILEPGATPSGFSDSCACPRPFSVPTMGSLSLALHTGSDGEPTTLYESSPSIVVQSYLRLSNICFLQRVPMRPGFCFSLY